jgi:NADPH:quinone reductase-like Zn-dependent oxidoreductase
MVAPEYFQQFIDDIENGKIKVRIGRTFNLNEIEEAYRLMDANGSVGKIVMLIG